MEKIGRNPLVRRVVKTLLNVTALLSFVAGVFISCQPGLGTAVDTQAPSIDITYPPMYSVIREDFVLSGTWDDDQGVKSVQISIYDPLLKKSVQNLVATVNAESKSWSINLNNYDETAFSGTNGWELSDGTYEITATAVDGAGHKTSASRSFNIDNTAPVLLLGSPLKFGNESAETYGRTFSLSGDYSDSNSVEKITVKLLPYINGSIDETAPIEFQFDSVAQLKSSLTVAEYCDSTSLKYDEETGIVEENSAFRLRDNYLKLYKNDASYTGSGKTKAELALDDIPASESLTKEFYAVISLEDDAKTYKDSGDNGTGAGNVSTEYYINNDTFYTSLMTKSTYNLTAEKLRDILNGVHSIVAKRSVTADYEDEDVEAIKTILKNFTVSSESVSKSSSIVSINPDNAPRFKVDGYEVGFDKDGNKLNGSGTAEAETGYREANPGSDIAINFSAGRDNSKIIPKNIGIKLYCMGDDPADALKSISQAKSVIEVLKAGDSNASMSATWSTKISLDAGLYELSNLNYYRVVITGTDADGNSIISDQDYGFKLVSTGNPPELSIISINDEVYSGDFIKTNGITIIGEVETDAVEMSAEDPVVVTLSVTDTTTNTAVSGQTFTAPATVALTKVEGKSAYSFEYKVTGLTVPAAAKRYKYQFNFVVRDENTKIGKEKFTAYVDTKKPEISITSVAGYVNGLINVSANVTDNTAIGDVSYSVYKESDTGFTSPLSFYSVTSVEGETVTMSEAKVTSVSAGNAGSPSFYINLSGKNAEGETPVFADGDRIVVRLTAKDDLNYGANVASSSSGVYIIDKAAPLFVEGNAAYPEKVNDAVYDSTAYFNSSSVSISGYYRESGSGISALYYTITDGTAENTKSSLLSTTVVKDGSGNSTGYETYNENIPLYAGVNTITLYAVDKLGNRSENHVITVKQDNVSPVVTASGSSYVTNRSDDVTVNFNVYDDADGSGVSSVSAIFNGNEITETENEFGVITKGAASSVSVGEKVTQTGNAYTLTLKKEKLPETSNRYNVTVTAKDGAGNNSSTATVAEVTVDVTLPEVTIPTSGTLVFAKDNSFVTGTATDNNGLASVKYEVFEVTGAAPSEVYTSKAAATVNTTSGTSYAVNAPINLSEDAYENGKSYVVKVTARDVAGNEVTVNSAKYTVDKVAPVLVTGVAGKEETIGGKLVTEGGWFKTNSVNFAGYFTENGSGIDAIYYQVADTLAGLTINATNYETTKTAQISTNKSGAYESYNTNVTVNDAVNYVRFVAVDKVGNVSDVETRTVKVDKNAPVITAVTEGTPETTKGTAVEMAFTASDGTNESGIASYTVVVGSKINRALTAAEMTAKKVTFSATEIASLEEGNNVVLLTAKDAAENESLQTQIGTVNKDTKVPTLAFTSPEASAKVNGKVKISGTVSDDNTGVQNVVIAVPGLTSQTITSFGVNGAWEAEFNVDTLSEGDVTVTATATDNIGNAKVENLAISVDPDSDRSEITIDLETSTTWLKTETIRFTVKDDDGVAEFYVTETDPSTSGFVWTDTTKVTKLVTGGTQKEVQVSYNPKTDGAHVLYFYVKDTEAHEFVTKGATTLKQPKYKFNTDAAYSSASAGVEIKRDITDPKISNAYASISNATDTLVSIDDVAKNPASYLLNNSYAGGKQKFIKFYVPVADTYINETQGSVKITMYDSNNSDSGEAEYKVNGGTTKVSEFALKHTSKKVTIDGISYDYWESDYVDVSEVDTSSETESKNVVFTASDEAGNSKTRQFTLNVDNHKPEITAKTPVSGVDEATGEITIAGTAYDGSLTKGISKITWFVPTKTQAAGTDDTFVAGSKTIKNGSVSGGTTSQWEIAFDGINNPRFSEWVPEGITNSSSNDYATRIDGTSLWSVPVYFLVEDVMGNTTLNRSYRLRYNPDGDKAIAAIQYPVNVESSDSNDKHAVVGGSVRINGSAVDNESVKAVYMQFAFGTATKDGDGKVNVAYGDYDLSTFKTKLSGKNATYAEIAAAGTKGVPAAGDSSKTYNIYSTTSAGIETGNMDNWWGVKVTGTTSWYTTINALKEFNGLNGAVNYVKVRVCAVDNNGKAGEWSEGVSLWIDNEAPSIREAKLVAFDTEVAKTAVMTTVPPKTQGYVADMYVKDVWYLDAYLVDDTKVTGVTITENGTEIYSVEVRYTEEGEGASKTVNYGSPIYSSGDEAYLVTYDKAAAGDNAAEHGFHLRYPVSAKEGVGSHTYRIVIQDANSTRTEATYSINYDNNAPEFKNNLKSSNKDLGVFDDDGQVSMSKVHNSDYTLTFGNTVSDNASGFERLAYYFLRGSDMGKNTRESAGTMTVELPAPEKNAGGYKAGTALVETVDANFKIEETGLYGKEIAGTRPDTITFESGSTLPDYVRAGGLIKMGGVFYRITSVEGTTVIFDGNVETGVTSAFFPMAFVVDNMSIESGSMVNGVYTYASSTPDDGDGVHEYIKKEGINWNWESSVYSDELEDGEVTIVCVAFDKAGNSSTQSTTVMISNRAPRLANVYAAVDLNADGKFSDSEIVQKSAKSGADYVQKVALEDTGLTMTDSLGLAFEFVGGANNNGYGAGEGDLSYMLGVSNAEVAAASLNPICKTATVTAMSGAVTVPAAGTYDSTDNSVAKKCGTLPGIKLPKTAFYNTTAVTLKDGNTYTEGAKNWINVTLWDNANGKAGTTDVADVSNDGYFTSFGGQYTVVSVPVTMDLIDGSVPAVTFGHAAVEYETTKLDGHVDLGTTVTPSGNDKVSGKVVFEGTINEERQVRSVKLSTFKLKTAEGADTAISATAPEVASFANGTLTATAAATANENWKFYIVSQEFTKEAGHAVNWRLVVDTKAVTGVSASGVSFVISAGDGTGTNTAYQTVDIVPYITGIARKSGTSISGNLNRSKNGRYSVAEGETLVVSGYNLGTSGQWTAGNNAAVTYNNATLGEKGVYSFEMTVPGKSGALTVTTGATGDKVTSCNNSNDNTKDNNVETFGMGGTSVTYTANDDRYLCVWALGNYFNGTKKSEEKECEQPVMTANADGKLFASWGTASNGSITFSYGMNNNYTAVYNSYDQPANYTSVAFDKKGTSGSAAVMYMAELQGCGGTFSEVAMCSSTVIGGATVTQITKADIEANGAKGKINSGKKAVVTGNPSLWMDNDNTSGYYALGNYDMQRRLGVYKNPRNVRYNNYLHNIWYDEFNECLKYSVVNLNETKETGKTLAESCYYRGAAEAGWVVLDGGYTQQDRVINWKVYDSSDKVNNIIGHQANYNDSRTNVSVNHGVGATTFEKIIFMAPNEQKKQTKTDFIGNTDNSTYLVMNNVTRAQDPKIGDTIALLQNSAGNYKIALRTITKVNDETVTWNEALPEGFTIHTATIYEDNFNIVGAGTRQYWTKEEGGKVLVSYTEEAGYTNHSASTSDFFSLTEAEDQAQSAGSAAAIDVTSTGLPVVAYYDATHSELKVAYANAENARLAGSWSRVSTGKSCTGEISMKVDANNNIHIMYNNNDGAMCYVFGQNSKTDGTIGTITWSEEEVVDDTGSLAYGSLSLIKSASGEITPAMTWLNKANTDNALKYAYRTSAPDGTVGIWDFMILPSLGTGHLAIKENPVSLEASNNWTGTDATVLTNTGTSATPATVESVIAFKTSSAFETAYLKKE